MVCGGCTKERVTLPRPLVGYILPGGWWKEGDTRSRVCEGCFKMANEYESVKDEIQKLQTNPPSLVHIVESTAMKYYLLEARQILNLFPNDPLCESQIRFLVANKEILSRHSRWLIHLLKIPNISFIGSPGVAVVGCEAIGCPAGCTDYLGLGYAINILVFPNKFGVAAQDLACKIISTIPIDALEPYIPALVGCGDEVMRILTIRAGSGRGAFKLSNAIYWGLNSIGTPRATARRENFILELVDVEMVDFRRFIGALPTPGETINEAVRSVARSVIDTYHIMDPFSNDSQEYIAEIKEMYAGNSYSKPLFITYQTNFGQTRRVMYKAADVRKDACVIKLVKLLSASIPHLITYGIIPITSNSGMIEIVEGCETMSTIYATGSMSNFLQKYNRDKTVEAVLDIYRESLAFWTILTYVLGIGDRHFDNILMASTGAIFHIDFDFLFGNDPRLSSPKVRLNTYMIEGLGGETDYARFKEECHRIFTILRGRIDLIYGMLLNIITAEPSLGIADAAIKDHLNAVFFIGESEEDVKSRLEFVIDGSKDSIIGQINDYVHSASGATSSLGSALWGALKRGWG